MTTETFDVVVIGAGSSGLAAARAAHRRGMSVALIEATRVGGECLWWTCLPTKALLESAHAYYRASHCAQFGCGPQHLQLDYPRILNERKTAMEHFTARISETLLSEEGFRVFHGKGSFVSAHEVRVGEHLLQTDHIIVAVGALPVIPPIPGLNTIKYLTYMHIVNLQFVPPTLVIIGGGPVGCEFAQTFRRFGAEVTIVERFPRILNQNDFDVSSLARRVLEAEGVRILTDTNVADVSAENGKKILNITGDTNEDTLTCDEVLVVTGRRPHLDGLNIAATGMRVEQGRPVLRDTLQTSQPHIWVCGDAGGQLQFKHLAEYQGNHVGNNLGTSSPQPVDERVIPRVTFLDPELASVGLTEEQALLNYDTIVAAEPLTCSDRAVLLQQTAGFIKLIVNRTDGQIIGGHIAGPFAGDIIHEIALAMFAHIPVGLLAQMPRVYPSLYEPLMRVAREAHSHCK